MVLNSSSKWSFNIIGNVGSLVKEGKLEKDKPVDWGQTPFHLSPYSY